MYGKLVLDLSRGGVMAAHPRPTVRRRRLGAELKRLREAARVRMEDAGAAIDGDKTKISRIENGRQGTNRLELEALFKLYGVEDEKLCAALVTLAKESRRKGWWRQFDGILAPDMQERLSLEADASRIYAFQTQLVPGLLQTEHYAATVISCMNNTADEESLRSYVAVRMERRRIFEREGPPQFLCVVDEAVLHREVGGPAAMAEQLRQIAELSEHPCITVQVIPYAHGAHQGVDGPFDLYSYPDPMELDIVALDYLDGNLYLEEDGTVEKYRRAFDKLRATALSTQQSKDVILRLAQDLHKK